MHVNRMNERELMFLYSSNTWWLPTCNTITEAPVCGRMKWNCKFVFVRLLLQSIRSNWVFRLIIGPWAATWTMPGLTCDPRGLIPCRSYNNIRPQTSPGPVAASEGKPARMQQLFQSANPLCTRASLKCGWEMDAVPPTAALKSHL